MHGKQKKFSVGGLIILILVIYNVHILKQAFIACPDLYNMLYVTLPLLIVSIILYSKDII